MKYIIPLGVNINDDGDIKLVIYIARFMRVLRISEHRIDKSFVKDMAFLDYVNEIDCKQELTALVEDCKSKGDISDAKIDFINAIDKSTLMELLAGEFHEMSRVDYAYCIAVLNILMKDHIFYVNGKLRFKTSKVLKGADTDYLLIRTGEYDKDFIDCLRAIFSGDYDEWDDRIVFPLEKLNEVVHVFGYQSADRIRRMITATKPVKQIGEIDDGRNSIQRLHEEPAGDEDQTIDL